MKKHIWLIISVCIVTSLFVVHYQAERTPPTPTKSLEDSYEIYGVDDIFYIERCQEPSMSDRWYLYTERYGEVAEREPIEVILRMIEERSIDFEFEDTEQYRQQELNNLKQ